VDEILAMPHKTSRIKLVCVRARWIGCVSLVTVKVRKTVNTARVLTGSFHVSKSLCLRKKHSQPESLLHSALSVVVAAGSIIVAAIGGVLVVVVVVGEVVAGCGADSELPK